MGATHALTGVAAGLVTAPVLGVHPPAATVLFAVVTGGYALLPDLDHDSSSCSHLLGWATDILSDLIQALSSLVYRLTKGPADEDHDGEHRHFTHTLVFAVLVGLAAWWGGQASPWAVFGIVVFGVLLAEDRLGDWVLPVFAVAGLIWWGTQPDPGHIAATLGDLSGLVGVAVFLGCLVHDLGDMLTEHGVPLLWPIPIPSGESYETWYEIRPPALIRFRTGHAGETLVMVAMVAVISWWGWQLVAPHLHLNTG